jgi:hypothetical protein
LIAFLLLPGHCEEGVSKDATSAEDNDPSRQLLQQLTIGMMEVVDERTVLLRPTSSKDKKQIHLRLGNCGSPPRGSLSDGEYGEKVNAAKEALVKLVDKQALWYKFAPDDVQSSNGSPDFVLADLWSKGGRHVNSALKSEGHLSDIKEYESDIARDILGAAAKQEKEEQYKKLGEMMAEHEKEKKTASDAAKAKAKEAEEAEAAAEGLGVGGWIGILLLIALGVGVATNFGQSSSKKTSLNRKKGTIEKWWMKLKGA